MPFQYKKVLILGATSGIGWALAGNFVENGVSVIVVGRRKEKLDEFAKQYGSTGKASVDTAVFDVTKFDQIPGFAKDMFSKHPDLDCVFLNSGLQRTINWAKPESVDLDILDNEMRTNYNAFMHMTKAFLPRLMEQAPKTTGMIYTTSGLALIPMTQCPNYCASKAALHHMILAMRQQLKEADSNVKIHELYPPAVQTELHDHEHGQEKGRQIGMPLKDFVEEAWEGLSSDSNEQVAVQMAKTFMGFNGWEQERQQAFLKMNDMIKSRQ